MKYIFSAIYTVFLFLLSCDNTVSNKSGYLAISKADYSGCFLTQGNSLKLATSQFVDSLYYDVEESVISLHIDMVYNCCGLLKDSAVIQNNIVNLYIHDKCINNCVCKCICVFKFNYSITGFEQNATYFRVYVKSNTDKNYSIWKEVKYTGS